MGADARRRGAAAAQKQHCWTRLHCMHHLRFCWDCTGCRTSHVQWATNMWELLVWSSPTASPTCRSRQAQPDTPNERHQTTTHAETSTAPFHCPPRGSPSLSVALQSQYLWCKDGGGVLLLLRSSTAEPDCSALHHSKLCSRDCTRQVSVVSVTSSTAARHEG